MPAFSRNELLAMAHRKTAGQMSHGEMQAIAKKAGVSTSAISQALNSAEENKEWQGGEHNAGSSVNAHNAHDSKYDELELAALNKLEGLLAVETNIMKVSKIMEMLNSAKRRAAGTAAGSASAGANFITINMPAAIQQKLILNENKEVIEVDGRSLVTMPSAEVESVLQEKKDAEAAAKESQAKEIAESMAEKKKSLMELLGDSEDEHNK